MQKINIQIDIKTLRRKLTREYTYVEMGNLIDEPQANIHKFLTEKTARQDIKLFIRLCILAGIEPMSLITIEKGEN